jgi:hypothetical protein
MYQNRILDNFALDQSDTGKPLAEEISCIADPGNDLAYGKHKLTVA